MVAFWDGSPAPCRRVPLDWQTLNQGAVLLLSITVPAGVNQNREFRGVDGVGMGGGFRRFHMLMFYCKLTIKFGLNWEFVSFGLCSTMRGEVDC